MNDELIQLLQLAAGELRSAAALAAAPERIDASIWQDLADELDKAARDSGSDTAEAMDTTLTGKPIARLTTADGTTDLLKHSACAEVIENAAS